MNTNRPSDEKISKQQYRAPQITEYGNVRDITRAIGFQNNLDGVGNSRSQD